MKTIQIIVDRSRWMASVEYAYLKVISPTKKSIFITKWNLGELTEQQAELVWRIADYKMPEAVAVTVDEMKLLFDASIKTKFK